MTMILVDGVPAESVPADDRGLAYGDGVFRTLAMRRGVAELWPQQCAKLGADCRALDLVPPADADLRRDLQHISAQMPNCALRITVTRGSGGRGYALPPEVRPRRLVTASPLPVYPSHYGEQGIHARICTLRLAAQPRLAGIKHLNRLENVLARAEWTDPEIAEGLLLDMDGHVIEGTRCNLFLVEGRRLVTPDLSHCGVSGVTRDLVIDAAGRHGIPCRIEAVSCARVEAADEVFLVNSLIGAWPVARLEQRAWSGFAMTARVREWFDALRNPAD